MCGLHSQTTSRLDNDHQLASDDARHEAMINAVQQPMSIGSGPVKQNFSNFPSTDLNGKSALNSFTGYRRRRRRLHQSSKQRLSNG